MYTAKKDYVSKLDTVRKVQCTRQFLLVGKTVSKLVRSFTSAVQGQKSCTLLEMNYILAVVLFNR